MFAQRGHKSVCFLSFWPAILCAEENRAVSDDHVSHSPLNSSPGPGVTLIKLPAKRSALFAVHTPVRSLIYSDFG